MRTMQTTTMTKPAVVREGMRTPWGTADSAQVMAPGIGWVGTPGHGGIKLSPAVNRRMPDYMRLKGGWYEEDCEWAMVYVAMAADLRVAGRDADFDGHAKQAVSTLRNWFPDAYERFFGETIPEGESTVKDERIFKARHANDLIVISAVNSKVRKGFVEATATVGADRAVGNDRTFLVPSADYEGRGRFGFVIDDPAKYEEI